MVRPSVIAGLLLTALCAVSAPAQEQPGRFQIAPGEGGGFVRLDTRTGAVSHCAMRADGWFCEPIPGADSGLAATVEALSAEVARLRQEVNRLSAEVAALRSAPPAATGKPQMADEEAIGFAERVMRRFFDLVREMKHDDSGRS
jgi:outer membrane murein-binding lipoprotein Lpp